MSGMDMLFKSMGLDPEAMQKSAAEFKGAVQSMQNDMSILKAQNDKIITMLQFMKDDDSHISNHHDKLTDGIESLIDYTMNGKQNGG